MRSAGRRPASLQAFEQLYRENVRRVYALCFRLCGEARRWPRS